MLTILREKGMDIKKGSEGSRVIRVLEKENYYNVINGYKELFIDPTVTSIHVEAYKAGVKFDELFSLYQFDRNLRILYLKYLVQIENNFKTVLSHSFSKKYGHEKYLKLENFHTGAHLDTKILKAIARKNHLDYTRDITEINKVSAAQNIKDVTKLIGDIHQELSRQLSKSNPMVSHHMTSYGDMPLWVLVNVLTFGKITQFYKCMKDKDKTDIAKEFNLIHIELHKYMEMLGIARNKCAHDERFFDIRFRKHIHTKSIKNFSSIGLPKNSGGSYTMGTNDAFAIAVIFKQMLSKSDFRAFESDMNSLFKKLDKQLVTISVLDIQKKMGYPVSWNNLKNI